MHFCNCLLYLKGGKGKEHTDKIYLIRQDMLCDAFFVQGK